MNNGAPIVYTEMQSPCSKELPPNCTPAVGTAEEGPAAAMDPVVEEEQDYDEDGSAEEDATAFGAENSDKHTRHKHHRHRGHHKHGRRHHGGYKHHGHHHHKKRHRNHHHKHKANKRKNHKSKHRKQKDHKHRHPYKDLCVAVGDYCGNKLHGCNFVSTTLYRCEAIGEPPKPIEPNSPSCGPPNPGLCVCPASAKVTVCGSTLPEECKATKNTIYDCSAGAGSKPLPVAPCKPGVECVQGPGSEGATCGSGNCDCTGDQEVCSDDFPETCGLEKNAIYQCAKSGKPEKIANLDPKDTCLTVSDGSFCRPNDCKCLNDSLVCGEAFPPKCNLKANAVYNCKKGGDPVFKSECEHPGRCSASKAAADAAFAGPVNDKCVDGCTCGSKGPACTSTFPPECNLPVNSIVQCSGFGAIPTDPQTCEGGSCIVNNGDDFCSNSKCICPGDGDIPVCGSELPKECNAEPNAIYHCPRGKGTKPEKLAQCEPETVCNKKPAPDGAACGGTDCECPGDDDVCGHEFPDSCGLDANAVYKCTLSGRPEKKEDCDAGHACVKLVDGAVCTPDDCKCPSDSDVCGDIFPLSCKINTGNLYTCVKGQDPVLKEACGSGECISSEGSNGECVKDPCKCQAQELVCGLTFPDECKFLKDTLYECSGKDATPEASKNCEFGCLVTAGDDKYKPPDAGPGPCQCPAGGKNRVCGSQLPAECKADRNTVYDCSAGSGSEPERVGPYKPGVECVQGPGDEGAVCGSNNCDCTGEQEVCSNDFPARCGMEPNAIYKCIKTGTPQKIANCDATETCLTVSDGSFCRPDDCRCVDD
ncbi:hypothetical protein BGX33_006277 [Mortierella sp. NVP41]|nr:hypothetical protein BGX33_006277 [Mortierella sp. NVP41]